MGVSRPHLSVLSEGTGAWITRIDKFGVGSFELFVRHFLSKRLQKHVSTGSDFVGAYVCVFCTRRHWDEVHVADDAFRHIGNVSFLWRRNINAH